MATAKCWMIMERINSLHMVYSLRVLRTFFQLKNKCIHIVQVKIELQKI